eukprot:bmy_10111T0
METKDPRSLYLKLLENFKSKKDSLDMSLDMAIVAIPEVSIQPVRKSLERKRTSFRTDTIGFNKTSQLIEMKLTLGFIIFLFSLRTTVFISSLFASKLLNKTEIFCYENIIYSLDFHTLKDISAGKDFSRLIEKAFLDNIVNDQIKIRGGKVATVTPVLLIVTWTYLSPFFSCSQKEDPKLEIPTYSSSVLVFCGQQLHQHVLHDRHLPMCPGLFAGTPQRADVCPADQKQQLQLFSYESFWGDRVEGEDREGGCKSLFGRTRERVTSRTFSSPSEEQLLSSRESKTVMEIRFSSSGKPKPLETDKALKWACDRSHNSSVIRGHALGRRLMFALSVDKVLARKQI